MTENTEKSKPRDAIYDATRTILLATIGAASLAQEEMMNFVDRLVDRGELAESDARKLVKEIMDRREKIERERKQEDRKNASAAATKADIDALTARIADLTRQIEEMKKTSEQ